MDQAEINQSRIVTPHEAPDLAADLLASVRAVAQKYNPGPCIVTPQEAQKWCEGEYGVPEAHESYRLAHTVATEPDRNRAAVVKALRGMADHCRRFGLPDAAEALDDRADAIENGADY